jgi:hypothetical protein
MEVPPEFGGKPGTSVPQVKSEHLKAAFELYRKYARMPAQAVANGPDAIQLGYTVGASLPSVSYRATMLELLTRVPQAPLAPWTREDGTLEDAVFWEAAHIPMELMTVGLSQTFPFDVDELVRRVRGHQQESIQ